MASTIRPRTEPQKAVMRHLSQGSAAWLLGISSVNLRNNQPPDARNIDDTYDAQKLVAWFVKIGGAKPRGGQRQQSLADTDGEISDATRKFRSEANILEMKELAMAGELVRASSIQQQLDRLADAIRSLGEDFGRSPIPIAGHDVQQKINEIVSDLEWSVT